ncbi:MAG: hypothetical protein A2Y25_04550 [Candidatus Melainabacteria bacterium GWF2_37_15]|nr:MAG: hypothetical protein A2Y25_04550 [Candidatus Melainabacteria bacterium GWF2_37_15]
MLKPKYTKQYNKDIKRLKKQGLNFDEFKKVTSDLINEISLVPKHKDHNLVGNYNNHRECHVKPNWLLVYQICEEEKIIKFIRTGSHSELFKK